MKNWIVFFVMLGVMACLFVLPLPSFIYLIIAWFTFSIANSELRGGRPSSALRPAYHPISSQSPVQIGQPPVQSAATAQVQLPERPMLDNLPTDLKCPSCGATVKPTDKVCPYCGSTLKPLIELPEPAKLAGLEVGKSVSVNTPQQGEVTYTVRGRLLFTELWQASNGPNVPWTPTGNYYAGFALEPHGYLLNWQDRFYLMTESRPLTDMDINRDFLPYARQFAQSNQTARVNFSYAGSNWQMVDIGRYAIEYEDGEGNHLHKGAIGRFIHAGNGNQALVVDDFQSGGSGGQDTVWKGFLVKETDIKF